MRVNIGPYRNEIRCWKFFTKFEKFFGEKFCDNVATVTQRILDFCVNKWMPDRTVEIRIDPYDTWNMDHTLSLIILPMLRQLKEVNHGIPFVHESDLPKSLRGNKRDPDEDHEYKIQKWNYIQDEMIWAFEQIANTDSDVIFLTDKKFDTKGYREYEKRINRGTRFFGKYFRALWD